MSCWICLQPTGHHASKSGSLPTKHNSRYRGALRRYTLATHVPVVAFLEGKMNQKKPVSRRDIIKAGAGVADEMDVVRAQIAEMGALLDDIYVDENEIDD